MVSQEIRLEAEESMCNR